MRSSDTETPECVVYPVFGSYDEKTFEVARDIATGAGMTLLVVDLLSDSTDVTADARKVGGSILDSKLDDSRDVDVRSIYQETSDPVETVTTVARNHDTRLMLFDEHTPDTLVRPITADVSDRISEAVPCDAVTVERVSDSRLSSILVPVAGGPHSTLSVHVAGAVARCTDAVLELFHVSGPTGDDAVASEYFDAATEQLPSDVDIETWHLDAEDIADAIVEQSGRYDMTVLGEPERGRLRRFAFGSITDDVTDRASNTVLVCRRSSGRTFTL